MQVITPSLKPVLSWLVIFDEQIRQKVFNIESEIIFASGDPNRLSLETRCEILKSICSKISFDSSSRTNTDYASVQNFTSSDIADEIKSLFIEYEDNSDVIYFLMRMIWQGRIKKALPEAKAVALDSSAEKYCRISAIRALKAIKTKHNHEEILQTFLLEDGPLDRGILSEYITLLNNAEESVIWLFKALEKTAHYEEYGTDNLNQAVEKLIERLDPSLLTIFLNKAILLFKQEPVLEYRFCELSEHHSWLMVSCAKAIEILIKEHHPTALDSACLSLLVKMPSFRQHHNLGHSINVNKLPELIRKWNDINHALFWASVTEIRQSLHQKKGEQLTHYSQASIYGEYWTFDKNDFEQVISEISTRELLDDKLVALSLAFRLHIGNDRPVRWLNQLQKSVASNEVLIDRLNEFLHPPAETKEQKKWKKEEAKWERKNIARQKKQEQNRSD